MLALKKGEFISLQRYSNVIFVFSVVISIFWLSVCIESSAASEAEPNFALEHIEKSCIEKCPEQVSSGLSTCKIFFVCKKKTFFEWGSDLFFGS